MDHPIAVATKEAGGQADLARLLGVTPAAVGQWAAGIRKTPPDRCAEIEKATGGRVSCEVLRPDVRWVRIPDPDWPHPDGRPCLDLAGAVRSAGAPQGAEEAADAA